ncbi:hypothetical protein LGM85_12905 [Burkholderia multivorans]|nr:hypothetical protein [Burkholderia multivorans]MDN7447348.1 hypothetical protein [Burkholderia multivorans]MDN7870300.1 hypothetical protein [Burkholderia multivorans]
MYDINPYAYADEYYSGRGVDSYPVQTGINRDREELDYYQRRAPERIVELAEAETNLARVEDEVLISVLKMRPSTGRVPWPRPLKSLESERYQVELRLAREEERSKARHARVMEILNNRAKKDDESFRAAIAKLVEGIKIEMEKMPNAKRENFASRLAERLALLEQGEIGPLEFLSDFSNE